MGCATQGILSKSVPNPLPQANNLVLKIDTAKGQEQIMKRLFIALLCLVLLGTPNLGCGGKPGGGAGGADIGEDGGDDGYGGGGSGDGGGGDGGGGD